MVYIHIVELYGCDYKNDVIFMIIENMSFRFSAWLSLFKFGVTSNVLCCFLEACGQWLNAWSEHPSFGLNIVWREIEESIIISIFNCYLCDWAILYTFHTAPICPFPNKKQKQGKYIINSFIIIILIRYNYLNH